MRAACNGNWGSQEDYTAYPGSSLLLARATPYVQQMYDLRRYDLAQAAGIAEVDRLWA